MKKVRFIDLFCGMGGFRLGFESAAKEVGLRPICVFSSEIKPHAISVYQSNFPDEKIAGDITKIPSQSIPDFDVLLAGFPCQAFSSAGKREGFLDTRGTLFFEIERILKDKRPEAFILENVEGLVKHDQRDKSSPIGNTLKVILESLSSLGYFVSWKVLNGTDFGVPQNRKRIFIVGSLKSEVSLQFPSKNKPTISSILEPNQPLLQGKIIDLLLEHYEISELYGKSVKDKRGGKNNIHSWDIELKGATSKEQRYLMGLIMRARRNKKWAKLKGIQWMDGMPLTLQEIRTFYNHPKLEEMLKDLTEKQYLKLEHPKDIVEYLAEDGSKRRKREYRYDLEKGYNIVAGKLSYEINKILDPNDVAPTLVATDLDRIVVPDNNGLRQLSSIEKKRLFGFPDDFILNVKPKEAFDLFGNTVIVNVVEAVAKALLADKNNRQFVNETQKTPREKPQQIELL